MNYAIEILLEQKELLTEELRFAESEEREQIEQRLIDTVNALNKLNIGDVSFWHDEESNDCKGASAIIRFL